MNSEKLWYGRAGSTKARNVRLRILAVVDPFAIENTEELENFTKRLIAEAIEERHRRGLSQPALVEADQ